MVNYSHALRCVEQASLITKYRRPFVTKHILYVYTCARHTTPRRISIVIGSSKVIMSARTGGRQSMSELKLRRLIEHNQRLRDDLARPRMRVSEASASLIRYCKTTKDHLVPSVWGPVGRAEDPYGQQTTGKCCSIQ